jgi:micrococcal nuclease
MLDLNQKTQPPPPEGLRRPAPFPSPLQLPPKPPGLASSERSRLPIYVGLALIAGFAFGFVIAKYGAWSPPKPNGPSVGTVDRALQQPNSTVSQSDQSTATAQGFHKVTDILRADTIKVDGVGTVKLLGIETPDGKEPKSIFGVHGQNALNFARETLLGKDVRLEFDPATQASGNKDVAGNILAYVYTRDGTLFNGEMVKQGHAFVDSTHPFAAADQFRVLERGAMEAMRGVWGPASASIPSVAEAGVGSIGDSDHTAKSDLKSRRLTPILPSELDSKGGLSSVSPSDPMVFVSADDKMYHKDGCPYLGKKKREIPLSEAKSEGYVACGRCFASTVLKAQ